jgi:exodeoxyribonuclease VII small subunit
VSDQPTSQRTFEEALSELEVIVRDLEDGSTGLEEALARYEAGIGLLKHCYGQLRLAEQRIMLLTGTDDEGQPQLSSFEHLGAVEPERTDIKRRRGRASE